MHSNQKGFSIVEVVLVIVILALVGFVGYYVFNQRQGTIKETSDTTVQTTTNQSSTANDIAKAPASINSTSDLDKAISTVDGTDVTSSSDVKSLDTQLTGF